MSNPAKMLIKKENPSNAYKGIMHIGKGTFGDVYQATNEANQTVAIKRMEKDPFSYQEIEHTLKSQHANVVKVLDVYEWEDGLYLGMECYNADLFDFVAQHKLNDWQIKKIFLQVLESVEHVHSVGVFHRDVKPENILLDSDLGVHLCDFGLSTHQPVSDESGVGSISYMAPEVISGTFYSPEKADIWSLGITLMKMILGKVPWQEASKDDPDYFKFNFYPETFRRSVGISKEAFKLLRKALNSNPTRRLSIQQFIIQFNSCLKLTEDQIPHKIAYWDEMSSLEMSLPFASCSPVSNISQVLVK